MHSSGALSIVNTYKKLNVMANPLFNNGTFNTYLLSYASERGCNNDYWVMTWHVLMGNDIVYGVFQEINYIPSKQNMFSMDALMDSGHDFMIGDYCNIVCQ